jgi:RNA polymerase sigma-70 factor (ECF subfamily)
MDASDPALVVMALAGDEDAFRHLTERHSLSVFQLAYRMTGNEEDAEDVVQETFLRAFRNLKRYESRSLFSTWLYRIAANYSLDLIRSRKRFIEKPPASDKGDWLNDVACPQPTAERMAMSGQIRETIERAMSELTVQERAAFVLRHYHELSIEEISKTLRLGENATKHSIFRAVRKLRRALEPLAAKV